MSYIIHFTTAATNKQGCTSTLDIGHRPKDFAKCLFDFSVERTNVPLLSCQCGHCLGFFLCACDSWTLHSRFCDWLVAHSPSLHMTIKHSHSHLFLCSLTQHWPQSACGLLCHIGQPRIHGFHSGAYKYCLLSYCSLCGPVLNLLLCMGKNKNILFLLVREACV